MGSSNDSRARRRGTVFGILFTAFSSFFLCYGLWAVWNALETFTWRSVPCVIERFEIAADQKQDPSFRPDLVYHYEIDGRKYTGTRLWKKMEGRDDYEELAEVRERFAKGPEGPLANLTNVAAECRIKPGEPETSTLMPAGSGQILVGLVPTFFGVFFVLIGFGIIFGGSAKTAARWKGTTQTPFAAVIAFLFFGCAGLALLGGVMIPKAVEYLAMRGWKETEAQVIWSRIRRDGSGKSATYVVDIFHRYQVDGREYRSNRYAVMGGSPSSSKARKEVIRAHPAGSKLSVFVDPDKPWRAVVKRDFSWWSLMCPLPFIAGGAGGLWVMHKKRREGASVSGPRSRKAAAGARR